MKTVSCKNYITSNNSIDGFQYVGEMLNFFPTAEGYVRATPAGDITPGAPPTDYAYSYVFNYTDHLGNVRLSYSMDHLTGKLKILEENHYYPFGLRHGVYDTGGKKDFSRNPGDGIEPEPGLPPVLDYVTRMEYQYKYNGKELQDELGLDWYDYGWRNYDAALGRWMNMDEKAGKYPMLTPYNYVANNPIIAVDPDGKDIYPVNNPMFILMILNAIYNTDSGKATLSRYLNNDKNNIHIMTSSKIRGIPSNYPGYSFNIQVKKNIVITQQNARKLVRQQAKNDNVTVKKGKQAENDAVNYLLMYEGVELKEGNNTLVAFNPEMLFNEGEKKDFYSSSRFSSGLLRIFDAVFHEMEAHANSDGPNAKAEHKKLANTEDGNFWEGKSEGTLLDEFLTEAEGNYEGEEAQWMFKLLLKITEDGSVKEE